MPEVTNNTEIKIDSRLEENSTEKTMIAVRNVGMTFNMASEQLNNLKEYFLAIVKHNLFFKELRALDSINFEIHQGDVFGIVGTNGSGKSTLLKIVAGVLEPTNGSIEINGNIAPLIELGAGFDMELSARENIYLNGALLGHSKEFIDEHFDEIVEFSEIEKFLDMPMKNYSSGMIARIAFAIATIIIPEILIVDEVLSVGDFMFQKKCEDKILELIKNHNTTVLIVSHSNEQIKRLCNKAIWIEKGHTRMLGSANEVCDVYGLIGGREGSIEAENIILKANNKCKDEDANTAHQIANGETFPEVCLSLNRLADQNEVDTICLVSQGTHLNVACANAFAGATHAPVISFSDEKIDYHIIDWIESKRPAHILIFNALHGISGQEYLKHDFSWKPSVKQLEITSEDPFEITCQFYDELENETNLSTTALITSYADYEESSVLLSGHLNAYNIPYFCMDLNNETDISRLKELTKRGITNLILAGKSLRKTDLDQLETCNLKIIDLTGENLRESQKTIHRFLKEEHCKKSQEFKNALIVPNIISMHTTGASSGYFSNEKEANTLIVDNTDLDSIAYATQFIEENRIEELTFLGGPGELPKSVVDFLSKVAANNQKQDN